MRLMTVVCVICLVGLGSPILAQQADKEQPKEITNSIGIRLVLIPKGTFTMGSAPSEEGSQGNEFQYEVTISQDYYLGVTEVTQGQYLKVMGGNPSRFQGDEIAERTPAKKHPTTGQTLEEERVVPVDSSNYPVERVTCNEAAEFCERLSALPEEQAAGRVYRLATEAEWEYACRAGSKTAYCFGDAVSLLADYAWYRDNSGGRTHAVGQKKPNAWGLYDMHGNVWEWCADWFGGEYPKGAVTDPRGPGGEGQGLRRVDRGGGWDHGAARCRSANRGWSYPFFRGSRIGFGFRLALNPPEISE